MRSREQHDHLDGIFIPFVTPFDVTEEIDYGALKADLEFFAGSGVKGYLALGSNGENRALDEDEKLRVLANVVGHKSSDQAVLAGVTYDAQRDGERFLAVAADLGADFGLVLPPGYYRTRMTDEVLYRYFSTLADGSPLPLLLYNAPGFSGVTLSPALVGRLAGHGNIVGMKDSAPAGIETFLAFEADAFHVLAGSAEFLLPAMLLGSIGGAVSIANFAPSLAIELWKLGRGRDEAAGAVLQARVSRINRAISGKHGVAGVKAAMDLVGLRGGFPRRPLLPLFPEEVSEIRVLLIEEGLL